MYFRCSNSNNAWRTGITLTDSDLHAAYQLVFKSFIRTEKALDEMKPGGMVDSFGSNN